MKILKFVIPLLVVLSLLLPQALLPSSVLADDTLVDIDITSPWSIIAWIDLNAPNITLYLDGVPFEQIINQSISQAVSAAVRASVPNGVYSGASSPGWEGYFGIASNIEEYTLERKKFSENPGEEVVVDRITLKVYMGAGCGGAWGVADGWPDLWSRRQAIGFLFLVKIIQWQLEDMTKQMTSLESRVTALETNDKIREETLKQQGEDIKSLQGDAKTLEELNISDRLKQMEAQSKAQSTNIIILYVIAGLALSAAIALTIILYRRRIY